MRMCANVRHKARSCWHKRTHKCILSEDILHDPLQVFITRFTKGSVNWLIALRWECVCVSYLVTVTLHHSVDGLLHQISTWTEEFKSATARKHTKHTKHKSFWEKNCCFSGSTSGSRRNARRCTMSRCDTSTQECVTYRKCCICIKRFGRQRKHKMTPLHHITRGKTLLLILYVTWRSLGLTDAFPSVFRVHGQHGNVATTEHLLVHVKLTNYGSDTLLLHHGLWQTHTHTHIC